MKSGFTVIAVRRKKNNNADKKNRKNFQDNNKTMKKIALKTMVT